MKGKGVRLTALDEHKLITFYDSTANTGAETFPSFGFVLPKDFLSAIKPCKKDVLKIIMSVNFSDDNIVSTCFARKGGLEVAASVCKDTMPDISSFWARLSGEHVGEMPNVQRLPFKDLKKFELQGMYDTPCLVKKGMITYVNYSEKEGQSSVRGIIMQMRSSVERRYYRDDGYSESLPDWLC